jgi:adenine-specific DNA-methyltransferase
MATGESKTKWKGNGSQLSTLPSAPQDPFAISLSYPGKRHEIDILDTPPASVEVAWAGVSHESKHNRLYYGDNLSVLANLLRDPRVCGQVKLIYIDPPFSTNSVFKSRSQKDAYHDLLVGAHYIEFLRERLLLLKALLSEDGAIYVHIDDTMAFHIKLILDEVFGRSNFRNCITRRKCNPKNYTKKSYGNIADYIFFYTKSDTYIWNRAIDAWTDERAAKEYAYTEPETGRRFKKVPIHAPGT